MKNSCLCLFVAVTMLTSFSVQASRADDTATTPAAGAQGDRSAKLKAAFAQLDLTDAQKTQIQGIMSSEPAGRDRRQHIMAVLTPDQKAKLKEIFMQHQAASGGTAGA